MALAYDFDCRGGAEIDDQQVLPGVQLRPGNCAGNSVGTHFRRVPVEDFEPRFDPGLEDERLNVKVFLAACADGRDQFGHHAAQGDLLDLVRLKAVFTQHGAKKQPEFIGRGATVTGFAKRQLQFVPGKQAAEHMAVANVKKALN